MILASELFWFAEVPDGTAPIWVVGDGKKKSNLPNAHQAKHRYETHNLPLPVCVWRHSISKCDQCLLKKISYNCFSCRFFFSWAESSQGSFFLWHLRTIPLHLSPESCHLCHLEVICEQCWSLGQPKLVNQAEQTMQMEWKGEAMENSGPHCLGNFKAKPSCSGRCCLGPLVATLMSSLQNITFWKLYRLNAWAALRGDLTSPSHLSESPTNNNKNLKIKERKKKKKNLHKWDTSGDGDPHCPTRSPVFWCPSPGFPLTAAEPMQNAFCHLLAASPLLVGLESDRVMI